jgi:hypothetical protein
MFEFILSTTPFALGLFYVFSRAKAIEAVYRVKE